MSLMTLSHASADLNQQSANVLDHSAIGAVPKSFTLKVENRSIEYMNIFANGGCICVGNAILVYIRLV